MFRISPLFSCIAPRFTAPVALFAACLSVAHAQQAAPPKPPTPPAPPSEAERSQAYTKAIEALEKARITIDKEIGGSGSALRSLTIGPEMYQFANSFGPRLPAQTVSLNLKNTPVRDALAKMLGDAKINYVLDDDIPGDKRVTVSVSDVQISTALDLITQSAGVSWTTETRDKKTIVRVGKTVRSVIGSGTWNFPSTLRSLSDIRGQVAPRPLYLVGPKKRAGVTARCENHAGFESRPAPRSPCGFIGKAEFGL